MALKNSAFDDFVDDCFIEKHPLCDQSRSDALELVASRLIAELIDADDHDRIAA